MGARHNGIVEAAGSIPVGSTKIILIAGTRKTNPTIE